MAIGPVLPTGYAAGCPPSACPCAHPCGMRPAGFQSGVREQYSAASPLRAGLSGWRTQTTQRMFVGMRTVTCVDACAGMCLDTCCVPLESSRRGGHFEYRNVYTRAVDRPSAMPIPARFQ